ncbi:nucleoside-diphosphate-sugar epimerase [Paraburkholderia sp. GAS41]|jgi:nucleoside-diphosphate-sugar epimerase|uniref:DUF6900 domain-containing protein n=1 Tax=Paraburkholderia sp. GAS41 TaxID=3035134 RepID=UPI003D261C29
MSNTIHDERLELLRTISTDVLGIEQLEQTGKLTKDLRIIHIEDLAHALEAAYDAGLMVGHRVALGTDDEARSISEVFFP